MFKIVPIISAFALLLTGCQSSDLNDTPTLSEDNIVDIVLSYNEVTVDGKTTFDTTDPAVFVTREIVYYPEGTDFTFGEGTEKDMHSEEEAAEHPVINITEPGTYRISGKLPLGQISVDLGEGAKDDPEAKVTLILDGVDITCTVAPAVIFYNVYECGEKDEATAKMEVDTSGAGANVIIADGSVNNISGSYVAKIYKSYELSEDGTAVIDSKKLHKYDAAFYSKMSMNMDGGDIGDGILNITAENEGLDSELHLTINGGNINIVSGNDGINTNEDNISVTTVNGGNLNIAVSGTTGEGDGIDSNGWLVINGGNVTAQACSTSGDSGIDADKGIYINGGNVTASGNMFDRVAGGNATYTVFSFAQRQKGGNTVTLKNESGETVYEFTPENDYSYLVLSGESLIPGTYTLYSGETQLAASSADSMGGGMGMGGGRPGRFMPSGMGIPEGELPEFSDEENFIPAEFEGPVRGRPDKEGRTPPEMKEGDVPQGRPRVPEGEFQEGSEPPRNSGMGGVRPGGMGGRSELSPEFVISEGANYFTSVSEYVISE